MPLKSRGDLYGMIGKEVQRHGVTDEKELKQRATYCCFIFNEDIENQDERHKASVIMADTYVEDLRLFLIAINLLPEQYEGDIVTRLNNPINDDDLCVVFPMIWFWNVTTRAEKFSLGRLARIEVAN